MRFEDIELGKRYEARSIVGECVMLKDVRSCSTGGNGKVVRVQVVILDTNDEWHVFSPDNVLREVDAYEDARALYQLEAGVQGAEWCGIPFNCLRTSRKDYAAELAALLVAQGWKPQHK